MKKSPAIVASLDIQTSDGKFTAHYSQNGLASLDFPDRPGPRTNAASPTPNVVRWHKLTNRAADCVLAGRPLAEMPPLDLSEGTEFQQKVWAALLRIPAGRTETYGEIAQALKRPGGARAVGGACGANPIPLLVPCHRVLAAGGALGGFSSGLPWKKKLLATEGWCRGQSRL